MIKPTVGRVVWYHPVYFMKNINEGARAAIITHVHSDRCVNVAWFETNGHANADTSVTLVQEGDEIPNAAYCEWMPYQQAVAKGETPPVLHETPK